MCPGATAAPGTVEGQRAVAQQTFQTGWQGDGGFGGSLAWFSFNRQFFLPYWGTPLLQRHEECKRKAESAACPVVWISSAKQICGVVVGFVFCSSIVQGNITGHQCLQ